MAQKKSDEKTIKQQYQKHYMVTQDWAVRTVQKKSALEGELFLDNRHLTHCK